MSDQDVIYENESGYWVVMVEWDGGRPPTKWYNRLSALGLNSRVKPKETDTENPMKRRYDDGAGVTFQEGALILEQESTARMLEHLAISLGAKSAMTGFFKPVNSSLSNEDALVMAKVKSTLAKRGRPPVKQEYVISCRDCGHTSTAEVTRPVNCPQCGSFLFWQRVGSRVKLHDYRGLSLFENWLYTRFETGNWEVPVIDPSNKDLPNPKLTNKKQAYESIIDPKALDIVKKLEKSPLAKQVHGAFYTTQRIDREQAMRLLDAGFLSQFRDPEKSRRDRIRAITDYIERGGKMDGVPLYSPEVDKFDCYTIVGKISLFI